LSYVDELCLQLTVQPQATGCAGVREHVSATVCTARL